MDARLGALVAGQTAVQDELTGLRHDLLARFESSERTILTSVVEHLDQGQLATIQAALNGLETGRIPESDINEMVDGVQQLLSELQQQAVLLPGQQQVTEIISAPTLNAKHRLKVTLPIIPLLLSYEGEVELKSKLNLEAAWQQLVTKIRGM